MPLLGGLAFEELAELVEGHVAALEPRPRVGVGVVGVEAPDRSDGEAVRLFVRGECVERRTEDDAAEIPEDGRDGWVGHRVSLPGAPHVGKPTVPRRWRPMHGVALKKCLT